MPAKVHLYFFISKFFISSFYSINSHPPCLPCLRAAVFPLPLFPPIHP